MRFNGKKNNLKRKDFDGFARRVGIDERAKENVIILIDGKISFLFAKISFKEK